MNIFLVVFFPLMYFCLKSLRSTKIKFFYDNSLKSFLLAILVSFLYCFIDLIFTSSYKQVPDNFLWNLGYFYKDIDANLSYNYYIQALMWNPELFRLEVYQKADGPNLYECQNLIIENKSIFKLLENFAK